MMDITHFYVEKGQGDPLILLHGNGEDHTYFDHQIDVFAQHYHVYALDTRGHGQTPRGTRPFTIRQFADDLLAFMDARHIERAHLLGFSDGGNIAMIFALRYPERVDRLILNGANLDTAGVKRHIQIPIEIGYRIARLFAKRSTSAQRHAELLGLMVNDPNIPVESLARIQAKTLVIAGTNDMIKEKHTRLIAANIPDAQLVIIQGNHFIAHQRPLSFNQAALEFLKD